MKNILIIGSYGANNIGDEAMLEVLLKKLPKTSIKRVLSGNFLETRKRYKVESAPHFPFGIRSFFNFAWLWSFQFLLNSDLVILGGGGLFTDSYSKKAVPLWSWHVLWAKLFGKKIILFANSIGPCKSNMAQKLTSWALKSCDKLIVRDELSAQYVKQMLPQLSVHVGADLAFLYDQPKKQVKKKLLALNLRPWNMNNDSFHDLIQYAKNQGYGVLLIPMEPMDEKLLESFTDSEVSLIVPKDFSELLNILSQCEKAIGMRLHFLIAATMADCSLAGIAYSSKVEGVLNALDLPYLVPDECNTQDIEKLFHRTQQVKSLDKEKKRAEKMFDLL